MAKKAAYVQKSSLSHVTPCGVYPFSSLPEIVTKPAGRSGRAALEQLPEESKQWLPPLPYRQPSQVCLFRRVSCQEALCGLQCFCSRTYRHSAVISCKDACSSQEGTC